MGEPQIRGQSRARKYRLGVSPYTDIGAPTPAAAHAMFTWRLRRSLSAAICRANVNHAAAHVRIVGGAVARTAAPAAASAARFYRMGDASTTAVDFHGYHHGGGPGFQPVT